MDYFTLDGDENTAWSVTDDMAVCGECGEDLWPYGEDHRGLTEKLSVYSLVGGACGIGGAGMSVDGERVMADARAYVLDRHTASERQRRNVTEAVRRYGLVVSTRGSLAHAPLGSFYVVEEEFMRLAREFGLSPRRRRRSEMVLRGLVGSGKAAAVWRQGVPGKSTIELDRD